MAVAILRSLLKLPADELFEEVQIPVRTATDRGVSISHAKKQRFRYGLGILHDAQINFRSCARQIGAVLAESHKLTALIQGAGPTGGTDQETAGVRFLGRLIDAAIGGRASVPSLRRTVERICRTFEAQLEAGELEVDWIYPIPGLAVTRRLLLSKSVGIEEVGEERFELLDRYAEGSYVSQTILMQISAALIIRSKARIPFGYSGRENSDTINRVVLAFLLSDLPLPLLLTCWPESLEPSVFELGQASWFASWSASPLAFFRHVTLAPEQVSTLGRIYGMVESCTEEILSSLPVRRAISSATRDNYEDRLIDLWIALEAILLRKDETSELQYRMAIRAAWIVKPSVFRDFEKTFKKAYGDRSKIVHGGRHTVKEENIQRCNWIFSLLKSIILCAIRQQRMPDLSDIEQRMVGRAARHRKVL